MNIRKVYAPFSQSAENTGTTPVEGYVDVNQAIYPAVNTGIINENGEWVGLKSSDKEFTIGALAEAIPNSGEVLFPSLANLGAIDMTGFNDIFIALFSTNSGNVSISAIMGPSDDNYQFANLSPVNPAADLKGLSGSRYDNTMTNLFNDGNEALTGNVWNIYNIQDRLRNQKNLQFKVINSNMGDSDINFAFLRVV